MWYYPRGYECHVYECHVTNVHDNKTTALSLHLNCFA
jgi:hypothetical protein